MEYHLCVLDSQGDGGRENKTMMYANSVVVSLCESVLRFALFVRF